MRDSHSGSGNLSAVDGDATGRPNPGPGLCFIVDDEAPIGRFITMALGNFGVPSEHFIDTKQFAEGLKRQRPDLIFLDISLGDSDAVEVIRSLAAADYSGAVQLISGRDTTLLEDVKRVGERHGLRMLPVAMKPIRLDTIRQIVAAEHLGKTRNSADDKVAAPVPPARQDDDTLFVNLGEALRNGWIELWYQPKIDLRRRRLMGAEGLARLRHPQFGLLPPKNFIPGASLEDMLALAEFALRTALRDSREFAEAGQDIQLAINVPVEALIRLPIQAIVRDHRPLRENWSGVILEVTEDQVIQDIEKAHEIATQLRIHGISLSIDDFGKGYSSLARLKELPFAELKLDRSFVLDAAVDATNAALCRTAVDLAHRFGSLAVAEGIEKESDLLTLSRLGCDVAQGFLFARAMPFDFLLTRLRAEGPDAGCIPTSPIADEVWRSPPEGVRALA